MWMLVGLLVYWLVGVGFLVWLGFWFRFCFWGWLRDFSWGLLRWVGWVLWCGAVGVLYYIGLVLLFAFWVVICRGCCGREFADFLYYLCCGARELLVGCVEEGGFELVWHEFCECADLIAFCMFVTGRVCYGFCGRGLRLRLIVLCRVGFTAF